MAKHTLKAAVTWMILSLLLVPSALTAREKHGEWLRIEKTDGSMVEGELLKVSGETLFLFDESNQHGCQVNVGDMLQFGLRRRTDVLGGIGIGLLAGIGVGFAGGVIFKSEEPVRSMFTYIPLGMIAGMVTNGFQGRFQTRRVAGFPEEKRSALIGEFQEMSKQARNYYPGIMR
ncbi:MAG TPA: hypothetical protein VF451_00885 [Acidobacteriota bacterium]